jgi:hypothetical protein
LEKRDIWLWVPRTLHSEREDSACPRNQVITLPLCVHEEELASYCERKASRIIWLGIFLFVLGYDIPLSRPWRCVRYIVLGRLTMTSG